MDESCSLLIWPDPNCFSSICGMGRLLPGLLPQESHQKRNSKAEPWGRVKGQPELRLKIGAKGHGKPNMLSLHPATERPYLRTGLRLRGHNVCLCPMCPASMGGASWATLVSTTLNLGQHANHMVSCHGERVLISASFSNPGRDWR